MLKTLNKNLSFNDCVALEKQHLCKIVVISKKQNIQTIQKAYKQGFRHFGESYAQEAILKQKALIKLCPDIIWHFVGGIQSNKLKLIVNNFSYLHSVDSLSILNKIILYKKKQHIQQGTNSNTNILKIFLQINISNDTKKSGFLVTNLQDNTQVMSKDFLESLSLINNFSEIYLQGFMTMPFLYNDLNKVESDFKKLQLLSLQYSKQMGHKLETSMGTSCDYKAALKSGSNWLRLGEIILGSRA
ncbi:MAG: YggS family pyridoxal phosphate-dependent enzyme [Bdellovibrionales bacterium]|nr:YggS family pyridoxal phosphate-dependent enzyme [Bdellovibrionales bacterium]